MHDDAQPGKVVTAIGEDRGATRASRLLVAAVIAIVSAIYTWVQHRYFLREGSAPDSLFLWRAANLLLAGENPWHTALWNAPTAMQSAHDSAWGVRLLDPLYYPMPAVVLWVPLAFLPYLVASTLFNAGSAFAFAYAVTRDGLHRGWLCGSIPFFIAMRFGQWSPLIAAAALLPWIGAVLVAKPNLGLPVYLSRATLPATIGCLALLVIPTVLAPWWVADWWQNIGQEMGRTTPHPAPVTMFRGAGVVLLLALLRWRQADARLLVAMACVPQLPYWADQLALLLVARTRREVIGYVMVTLLGMVVWLTWFVGRGDPVDTMRPIAVLCTYGPALVLILRRPNAGQRPPVIEAVSVWWARWAQRRERGAA